jgi:hypothetical protein
MDRDAFLAEIIDRLLHTHNNNSHRFAKFAVGDWVWLRLHQRLATAITDKSAGKLVPRFYGPYKVLDRVGDVAYRLTLPPHARIHCVFHVVFLKK